MFRFIKKLLRLLLLIIIIIVILMSTSNFKKEQELIASLPDSVKSSIKQHGGTYITLSKIPDTLTQAIIATEDRNFYSNIGISFEGIVRSVVDDIITGKYQEGGSTITQQLVRDQYLTQQKTLTRKLKEMVLALIFTQEYKKQDILEMYLNSVYFGHGAWGVDSAAKIYFNKSVSNLTDAQCTLLAGLPQAPSYYDPLTNPKAAILRQKQVLDSMVQAGYISQSDALKIQNAPLNLRVK